MDLISGQSGLSLSLMCSMINFTDVLQSVNTVKTEYSTFTYFITSLDNGKTVTSTDIVVSSNIVTSPPVIEATPVLQNWAQAEVTMKHAKQLHEDIIMTSNP